MICPALPPRSVPVAGIRPLKGLRAKGLLPKEVER